MIRSCVCHSITFDALLILANEKGITQLSDLQYTYNVCNKCKLCNPYIIEMFETGRAEFPGSYKPKLRHDRKNKMP